MESPIKTYKTLMNIDNIKDIAYETLFTKYIIQNLKGEDKVSEIDTTDQEGIMLRKNGGYPLPGFIYTFIYPPKPDDVVKVFDKGNEKEYVDYVPIVFCTNVDKIASFKGINLNTLPNLERVKFLEAYYRGYQSFFKDIEKTTQNDKLALNKAFINEVATNKGADLVRMFSKVANANFGYGYRTYNMQRIRQLRMIEYMEWDYIPFYDPKHAFKKMNQKQIHDLYWRTR